MSDISEGRGFEVTALRPEHHAGWLGLAQGYKAFYETPTTAAEYDAAWQRLMQGVAAHGLVALHEGQMLGFAHFVLHGSTWAERVCYLQDLFTAPQARGRGVARTLIGAVAQAARDAGASRYYWLTQEHNTTARALYDRVAQYRGFIRYDHAL
jgi:GNAT superfamily N-acetyltransferase